MNIEIEYVSGAQTELFRLLRVRTDSAEDTIRYTNLFLDDIEQQLHETEGQLPNAIEQVRPDGSRWWWRYIDGVWMAFTIHDRRVWLIGPTTRTVRVEGFDSAPTRP